MRGVVAAGHPLTAEAGAEALREGGNAVDAALAAMMTAFAAEPWLTSLGAGGYMLVAEPGGEETLLDFFVAAAGLGLDPDNPADHADLLPVDVPFGDVVQVFNVGAASCGAYGMPAGICEAHGRWGTLPLSRLAAPGIHHARSGVAISAPQAYVFEILAGIAATTPEGQAMLEIEGRAPMEGDVIAQPELADALERLGEEGAAAFYTGDVAERVCEWIGARGGLLGAEDLAAYEVVARTPQRATYRGREVLTNPPPSAGGVLIASALDELETVSDGAPPTDVLVAALRHAQERRTPEFLDRLGSTTHVSVLDGDGLACSVTSSNGSGSGVIVPGTGLHLNNMMGEQDLSPLGFFSLPAGRRMPSMMSPTIVRRDGEVEVVVGSAGSNRIRSAIIQVISRVVDERLDPVAALEAPRVHWEDGVTYCEPGIDAESLEAAGHTIARFRTLNLFFGGAQCVTRGDDGLLRGAGDPRRGGASVSVAA